MIITNSNQLHDQLWIYVRQKGVLGSWKLWFNYINSKNQTKIKILARFGPVFDFELKGKKSRAEPSWKSFSSSSGSSQLGSDSSLIYRPRIVKIELFFIMKSNHYKSCTYVRNHDIVQQFIVYYALTQNKLLERPLNSFFILLSERLVLWDFFLSLMVGAYSSTIAVCVKAA